MHVLGGVSKLILYYRGSDKLRMTVEPKLWNTRASPIISDSKEWLSYLVGPKVTMGLDSLVTVGLDKV